MIKIFRRRDKVESIREGAMNRNKAKYDVLIVEDNLEQAQLTKLLMEEYGLSSEFITDSSLALEKISQDRPPVVIVDLMMPKIDGLRLLKMVKSTQETADTKIIIYSGKMYESDRRKALELGADAFFFKPTRAQLIVETVKAFLEPTKHEACKN